MKLKHLALGICIALAFTGCSTTSNQAETTTGQETTTQKKTAKEEQQKEITPEEQASRDTLYWINGVYGIIMTRNDDDLHYLGGCKDKDNLTVLSLKNGLDESWGITDKKSADETIDWLLTDGHNQELLDMYDENEFSTYTRDKLEQTFAGSDDEQLALCIFDAKDKYGENAILAWDLSRALQLYAWCYVVGYYDYNEAMEKSLEVATRLQSTYTSWDDMMESYFYGYQYWSEDDIADPASEYNVRKQIYDELKADKDNPYTLQWDMTLNLDYALKNKMEYVGD